MAKNENTEQPHKYFDDQFDDEEVQYVFRKHPIVMRVGLIVGMGSWLIGPVIVLALLYLQPDNPPSMVLFGLSFLASVAFGMLLLAFWWIPWYFSVYIVTDQRFIQISQKGFFSKSVTDINLSQIQLINYEVKGVEETLLGFGTIMVQTFVGDLVIHDVHHPAKTARKLQMILRDLGIKPVSRSFADNDRDPHQEL